MSQNETNINTGGGSIIGAAIGQESIASDNTISITESFNSEASRHNKLSSVLSEIQSELSKASDIHSDASDDIQSNLSAVVKAVKKTEPNKSRAIEKLEGIQKILKSLTGSVVSATTLSKLVTKALALAATSL